MINKYLNLEEDSLSAYMRDVRKNGNVITIEKEVELAKKIQKGDSKALDELVNAAGGSISGDEKNVNNTDHRSTQNQLPGVGRIRKGNGVNDAKCECTYEWCDNASDAAHDGDEYKLARCGPHRHSRINVPNRHRNDGAR